jgi:rhamnulokinase
MPGSPLPIIVAIDLGAESCRVSLLQWDGHEPRIELIHRFSNAPVANGDSLHWDFDRILVETQKGLARCGRAAAAPIASIGVDGWAVDYVRVNEEGLPLHPPFCYRDPRTEAIMREMDGRYSKEELYAISGAQPLRINTVYQLIADARAGVPVSVPWINLPEYLLARLGGRVVAEYTNATHTGLVDIRNRPWSREIFRRCGLAIEAAPKLVATGTDVGELRNLSTKDGAFANTRLIATACHDTASAVAAIPLDSDDWAYISSGTWSLVGTLLETPVTTPDACAAGFTNQGAAGNHICFHKNVNGMWLLKQTMEQLCAGDSQWPMAELVAAAEALPAPDALVDVDEPDLLLPGAMASRINAQRVSRGLAPLHENSAAMPRFASLIFHSLAARYAEVLRNAERLTGKTFRRVAIVGGGSLNRFLNRLTEQATGLEVFCGVAESSTIGNLAIQLATLEGNPNEPKRIAHWAHILTALRQC